MRRSLVLYCVLAGIGQGCSFDGSNAGVGDATDCWSTFHVDDPCALGEASPEPELTASRYTIDTNTGLLTSDLGSTELELSIVPGSGHAVIFISGLTIPQGVRLEATGTRPLFLLVDGDVSIAGDIDVGSRGSALPAAGSPGQDCEVAADGADNSEVAGGGSGGGGGGAGGSNQGIGGNGDDGDDNGVMSFAGAVAAEATAMPLSPAGGCDGSAGGVGFLGGPSAAPAGLGGGAVQISARGTIVVTGSINAGGGGGGGGVDNSGGSGAGSGGYIGLDASTVSVSGELAANGGGGGGGNGGGDPAEAGDDGTTARALGGATDGTGSDGKDGSFAAKLSGSGTAETPNGGGGGGGGGAGWILSFDAPITGANVSPPPVAAP